jgi:hypothetical protein
MKIKQIISALIILTSVSASILFTQSCSNEVDNSANFSSLTKEKKELIAKFEVVGISHNEIMEAVYMNLSKQINTPPTSIDEIRIMTESSLLSANRSIIKKNTLKSINNSDDLLLDTLALASFALISHRNPDNLKSGSERDPIDETINNLINKRSSLLKGYISILFEITTRSNYTSEEYEKKVNTLIIDAVNNLDEDEVGIFLSASSTAKHSFEYWHANIDKWKNLLLTGDSEKYTISRLKSGSESPYDDPIFNGIVKADVAGAISGAIVGAVSGPGIAVAALAGSGGASTAQAVVIIWNEWGGQFQQLTTESFWSDFWNSWGF